MKMRLLFFSIALSALIASTSVVADLRPAFDSPDRLSGRNKAADSYLEAATASVAAYRSPGPLRKIVIDSVDSASIAEAVNAGAVEVADYGSFKLFVIDHAGLALAQTAMDAASLESASSKKETRLAVRDDFNALILRQQVIDTTDPQSPGTLFGLGRATGLRDKQARSKTGGLRLVQFIGPVKREWLDELRAAGMEIIAYVPNNGYLVRGTSQSRDRLLREARADYARGQGFIQWEGRFEDHYKIHPQLKESSGEVTVAVQIARSVDGRNPQPGRDVETVIRLSDSILLAPYHLDNTISLKVSVEVSRIADLAALENVINIEPWSPPELMDERGGQIAAGALTSDGKQPRGAGYMAWLDSLGFRSNFDFAIDVSDTGIDRGSIDPAMLHPDFLDSGGRSRVVYARDFTSERDPSDIPGHGTINLSIAGGANLSASARDADGYGHGVGVAPFARLGSSRIFLPSSRFDLFEPYSNLIIAAYQGGARISSNSWASISNSYTLESQEYDARVRDALPSQTGNQEMTIVFAAGNSGPGENIGSPGSGKNVISVGASENFRMQGTDGCNVKDVDADSAMDMAFFSSGGPLYDGRIKPDIVAPGSHVIGAASQHKEYDGSGVCGEALDKPFFPQGQTLYTWSSGTSHSTPIVAGAAALARQHFINRGMEPNSALIKALLLNTTTYMTGEGAGGNLPHPVQGWGLLNLGRAFDTTPRIFINQTELLTVTGQEFILTGEVKDATKPFRVTLAWTDAPGLSVFAPWVNNLDLEVVINGQVYRGNNFAGDVSQPGGEADNRENVESVWLPAGTVGAFLVKVKLANLAGDGVPGNLISADQDFALAVYNGERRDAAVATFESATLMAGANNAPDPGETAQMKINLGNVSPTAILGGRGTLATRTAGVTVTTAEADFPQIARGASGESLTSFAFSVASNVACGTEIEFTLDVSAGGAVSRVLFKVRVGVTEHTGIFADDIESGESKWTHGSLIKKKKNRVDTWMVSTMRFRSGASSWFTSNPAKTTDARLDTVAVQLPANSRNIRLVFYHTFSFEPGQYDGGVLEISDGGDFQDLGPKIMRGGYNGKFRAVSSNPLAEREGWVDGRLGEFEQVVVDLSSYAGKTVTIRFRIGADSSVRGLGWYIDDVTIEGERPVCAAAS
jgi:hypothetical protein